MIESTRSDPHAGQFGTLDCEVAYAVALIVRADAVARSQPDGLVPSVAPVISTPHAPSPESSRPPIAVPLLFFSRSLATTTTGTTGAIEATTVSASIIRGSDRRCSGEPRPADAAGCSQSSESPLY